MEGFRSQRRKETNLSDRCAQPCPSAVLVAIVREHTAQSSPQSAPADSQQADAAQPQGVDPLLALSQEALRGVPMSLPALLQMGGAGVKLQHALSGCVNSGLS